MKIEKYKATRLFAKITAGFGWVIGVIVAIIVAIVSIMVLFEAFDNLVLAILVAFVISPLVGFLVGIAFIVSGQLIQAFLEQNSFLAKIAEGIIITKRTDYQKMAVEELSGGKEKTCPYCGAVLEPGDKFCTNCGKKVE